VATVVLKLFNIVAPDVAFFGAKDYQQQLVVRRMAADLDLPLRIEVVPTVREPDGLAMSSRNRYLDPDQRQAALVLSKALRRGGDLILHGERDASRIRQALVETIESEPLARLDYAEVVQDDTLEPAATVGPGFPSVALVAARVGPARLIDNASYPG
jgi:pantoate--beta-alanine ligase